MARVDDGSLLLGSPGAPGCTTTGVAARSDFCACAGGKMEMTMPSRGIESMADMRGRQSWLDCNFGA